METATPCSLCFKSLILLFILLVDALYSLIELFTVVLQLEVWPSLIPPFSSSFSLSLPSFLPLSFSLSLSLCLSVFSFHSFFVAVPFREMQVVIFYSPRTHTTSHAEERWSFFSRTVTGRAGSLKVGHFGFSKSWSCMTGNFLSPSSSRLRAQ